MELVSLTTVKKIRLLSTVPLKHPIWGVYSVKFSVLRCFWFWIEGHSSYFSERKFL